MGARRPKHRDSRCARQRTPHNRLVLCNNMSQKIQPEHRPRAKYLRDLEKVILTGRDPRLPKIYMYTGRHPLRSDSVRATGCDDTGSTYVYLVDSSLEGKTKARQLEDEITVPLGCLETMHDTSPGKDYGKELRSSAQLTLHSRTIRAGTKRMASRSGQKK